MSDRIAVMNKGRYEQLAEPESLYERPTTRFVAGFLGVSNLLAGRVAGTAGGYAEIALRDAGTVRVPAALVNGSDQVEVGIRPEKIRLSEITGTPPAGHNQVRGVIRDASYIGVSTQYIVRSTGGVNLTVYEQNVERATRSELWAPGEEVILSWSPEHSFVIHDSPPVEKETDA